MKKFELWPGLVAMGQEIQIVDGLQKQGTGGIHLTAIMEMGPQFFLHKN